MATSLISNRGPKTRLAGVLPDLGLLVLGVVVGLMGTQLLMATGWQVLLAVLVAAPFGLVLFRYPFVGLALWLLLCPFLMTTETVAGRGVYWVIHRALPPLVFMLVAWKRHRTSRRAIPFTLGIPELAMAGYIFVSLVSIALQNRDPLATAYLLYDRVFSPMCIYMLIRLWQPDEEDLRRLMPVVFLLAACQTVIGILSWIGPQYLPAEWLKMEGSRTIGSLVNPSVYTVALIFSGGILVHATMTGKSVVRLLYAGTATLAFACVFLTLSRACWLAGLFALAGLVYSYPRQLVRLGIVSVLAVVIGGGLFLPNILDLARERLASSQSERSAISRLPVYLAGLRMFLSKPLFGWGYGNFDRYDREFQGQVSNIADDNKDHASHNFYLTLFAEQGLLGGALFLGPMMWWFAKSRKKALGLPPEGLWSRKLLGVLWLSILAHLVVNNFANMRVPFGLGLWWVSLGLIASLTASAGGQRQKRETGAPAQESRPAPWR